MAEWSNAHDLGVVGDGKADDTAALQRAIDTHRVVYLPLGSTGSPTRFDSADSVVIGLQPSLTQIALADNTPAYPGCRRTEGVVEVGAKEVMRSFSGSDWPPAASIRAPRRCYGALARTHWSMMSNLKAGTVRSSRTERDSTPTTRTIVPIRIRPPLGWPISQSMDHARRRWHIQRHLEPGYLRQRGSVHFGHQHAGAHVRDVDRAPRS